LPVKNQPWIGAINRLLKAELRPDPRPKANKPVRDIYWNGQDLAVAASIRANTLSDVMTGKREPSVSTLQAIAKAFGVPASALLMDHDEAMAYAKFAHSHTASAQTLALKDQVRRIMEDRAEEMKAAWIETQTAKVVAELTSTKPTAAPKPVKRTTKKTA